MAATRIKGILVGDLVIDTYLCFKPTPEVKLDDWYLFAVLRQAVKDIDTAYAFFRREKPALYLSTYATYIPHGIPARVAVALGIKTLSFANAQQFSTELTPEHLFHTKPCGGYKMEFALLPEPEEKRARAAEILGRRVAGIADSATANQRSAYKARTDAVADVRGAVVVFLHDFFDSAHIYRWMVFHDFWEWACTTIETLREVGQPFFSSASQSARGKHHRAGAASKQYPGLNIILSEVSNRQLVDAGMACAITVYGSVAAEMAFLGVPSISCGDNPHVSFDTFNTAASKEKYRALLSNIPNLRQDAERMKSQACAFYYMHYLNIGPDELALRDRMIAFYLALADVAAGRKPFSEAEMSQIFTELASSAEFRSFVTGVAGHLGKSAANMPGASTAAPQ